MKCGVARGSQPDIISRSGAVLREPLQSGLSRQATDEGGRTRMSELRNPTIMRKLLASGILGLLLGLGTAALAAQEFSPRTRAIAAPAPHALVIGNAAYAERTLHNPVNDAHAMAAALRGLGFQVELHTDLDAARMEHVLLDFGARLEDGTTGLFYFAGHGVRAGGSDLLLPIDADPGAARSILGKGMDVRTVLEELAPRGSERSALVLVDACRDGPFTVAGARDAQAGSGVAARAFVGYATTPGGGASDGAGGHGLYTAALLQAFAEPGLDLPAALAQAAVRVRSLSGGTQVPEYRGAVPRSLDRLQPVASPERVGGGAAAATLAMGDTAQRGILPADGAARYELEFWESIKDSEHPSDYEAYLQAYPNGRFAPLAKARIARLRKNAPAAQSHQRSPASRPRRPRRPGRPCRSRRWTPTMPPPRRAMCARGRPSDRMWWEI